MTKWKVLSVKQPWAHLLVTGKKDIENRTWKTKVRGWVLIHASKEVDRAAMKKFKEHLPPEDELTLGAIVGGVKITDCVTSSKSVWFEGPVGFVIGEAHRLKPVPMKGKLGFFTWEGEVEHPLQFCDHCGQGQLVRGVACPCRDIFFRVIDKSAREVPAEVPEWERWTGKGDDFEFIAEQSGAAAFREQGYSVLDDVKFNVEVKYRDQEPRTFEVENIEPEPIDVEFTVKEIA